MKHTISPAVLEEVISRYDFTGEKIQCIPFGSGHINDTFLVTFREKDGSDRKYVLQRINTDVFRKPVELMENMMGVTEHLRRKLIACGGDPNRETVTVIRAKDGKPYVWDSLGGFWRAVLHISDSISYDIVEKPQQFYESAVAFGRFQNLLSDYPAHSLHETIPGFHDTVARFAHFRQVVEADPVGRVSGVPEIIQFVMEREQLSHCFEKLLANHEIPLRVTHNDTKLNNVMFDIHTGKGICVLDLDTVMPGLAMNDFGDSIRFGASTALEDEQDLSKVWCDMDLFRLYAKGFLEGCGGKLTPKEVELLPMGAMVMTYECGMRFLSDYLEGDVYFRIHREKHNLDRARTQMKLVADMEAKWDQMQSIIRELS